MRTTDIFSAIATLLEDVSDTCALTRFFLNEINLSAEKTMYVGDKWEDGMATSANGVIFCAALWGYGNWDPTNLITTQHCS